MAATMTAASILVLALCMLGKQAAGFRTCGVDAVPHPQGICGEGLLRARNNLCFLLFREYPDFLSAPHKRSTRPARSVDTALDLLPLSALAALRLPEVDTLAALPMGGETGSGSGPLTSGLLGKRGGEVGKRSRGITCECCYNACKPSQLARYC